MVWVVELRRQENLFSRNPRCFDALADFGLVLVTGSGVDVSVSILQRKLHCVFDLARLGLPGACWVIELQGHRTIQGPNLPRPTVGMIAPVLSVIEVVAGMLKIVVGTIEESQRFKSPSAPSLYSLPHHTQYHSYLYCNSDIGPSVTWYG